MLPANLTATLRALALTDKPLITATPEKSGANIAKQFELGQQVRATVQAQVAPNVFNVRIADQVMQMQLPPFIRSGDTIQLQVVSLLPRLTFTLAASANPVSTPESLSAASRLLSSLSQQPLERNFIRPLQNSPLWSGEQALPDTTQLAGKLQDALSHSGLFYESHQAQWIAGTRPVTQLLLEPQNQLPHDNAARVAVNAEALAQQTGRSVGGQSANAPTIPQHLQTLVQQQLNALETHQVLWQGQAWQGQEMRWQVSEETPRHNAQGTQEGQWITRIDLDLPNLGGVSAQLSFNGGALHLTLDVADAATREKLGDARAQLVAALGERGIPVTHTQINQNEHA